MRPIAAIAVLAGVVTGLVVGVRLAELSIVVLHAFCRGLLLGIESTPAPEAP